MNEMEPFVVSTFVTSYVLYGVTMEDFAVSKPVGMRLMSADNVAKMRPKPQR